MDQADVSGTRRARSPIDNDESLMVACLAGALSSWTRENLDRIGEQEKGYLAGLYFAIEGPPVIRCGALTFLAASNHTVSR